MIMDYVDVAMLLTWLPCVPSEEDEARLGFNEDGSFIGQYYKKDPSGPPPPNYENHSSIA